MFLSTSRVVLPVVFLLSLGNAVAQQLATEGQFSVSSSGSAQYTVPIEVPAGAGGMQPSLALVYNSNSGIGEAGYGMFVAGLSRITRCARTIAQDGVLSAVLYRIEDGYCLDGQRLIPISGVNGRNGTEYRTESDSFSKIVSNGEYTVWPTSSLGGPVSFTVWTKSGRKMEFGQTVDSQIRKPGIDGMITTGQSDVLRPIRGWAVNKVIDRSGNYMTVTYSNLSKANKTLEPDYMIDDGFFQPMRVDYAGNEATGDLPMHSVRFQWSDPQKSRTLYEGGFPVSSTGKLKSVRLFPNGVESGYYKISGYSPFEGTGFSPYRVGAIAKCFGGSPGTCLPPVTFAYEPVMTNQVFQFWTGANAFAGAKSDYVDYFVDLNGDGKKSWIKISESADDAWVGSASSAGLFTADRWSKFTAVIGAVSSFSHSFGDVNGDGKADWIKISKTTNEAWVALGAGNGGFDFWTKNTQSVGSANTFAHYLADINGDGRMDLVQVNRTADSASVALAIGGGDFQFWTKNLSINGIKTSQVDNFFADIDGDGRADWMSFYRDAKFSVARLSVGEGSFNVIGGIVSNMSGCARMIFADLNGDKLADAICGKLVSAEYPATHELSTAMSLGNGKFAAKQLINGGTAFDNSRTADFDGDGMADIIHNYAPMNLHVFLAEQANSGGAIPVVPYDAPAGRTSEPALEFYEDINGDGKADYLLVERATNKSWIALSVAVANAKVHTVKVEQMPPTLITYKRINDASVHTVDADAVFPARDSVFPLLGKQVLPYVVSSVASDNGVGGFATTNYTYGGLKSELSRKNVLGFRWTNVENVNTGISTRTDFKLDWPYTGQAVSSRTSKAGAGNNGLLGETTYAYGCTDFVSATGCQPTQGRRYFTYMRESVSKRWDLNGAALPVATSTYEFDGFGNPTKVVSSSSEGSVQTKVTVFENDTTKWWIGMPKRVTTTNVVP
ncbi:MAG: FG-GAP-like repeat-containing protein [Pseudomonadota bacterium]